MRYVRQEDENRDIEKRRSMHLDARICVRRPAAMALLGWRCPSL